MVGMPWTISGSAMIDHTCIRGLRGRERVLEDDLQVGPQKLLGERRLRLSSE